MEAAIGSSSLRPEHRATLGATYSKFQLAKAGIMEAFVDLEKGFEVNTHNLCQIAFTDTSKYS